MSKKRHHQMVKNIDPMIADGWISEQTLMMRLSQDASTIRIVRESLSIALRDVENSHDESELATSKEYHRACRVIGLLEEVEEVFNMEIKI